MTIAVVLPVHNEAATLDSVLCEISQSAIDLGKKFHVVAIDDGSTDGSSEILRSWQVQSNADFYLYTHPKTLGLNRSLIAGHKIASKFNPAYVLRIDSDQDASARESIHELYSKANGQSVIVAERGAPQRASHEQDRMEDFLKALEQANLNGAQIPQVDPSFLGYQLYRGDIHSRIIKERSFSNYSMAWGLDFFMFLLATKNLGGSSQSVRISRTKYNPSRRPQSKVDKAFDTYIKILSHFTGIRPEVLSPRYGVHLEASFISPS